MKKENQLFQQFYPSKGPRKKQAELFVKLLMTSFFLVSAHYGRVDATIQPLPSDH
jgi:hypothetical protein